MEGKELITNNGEHIIQNSKVRTINSQFLPLRTL